MSETKTEEQKKPQAKPPAEDFKPRRLMVITGSPHGDYLADADTGEDLRLPIQNMRVHWASQKSHADCSFIIERAEQWKRPEPKQEGE